MILARQALTPKHWATCTWVQMLLAALIAGCAGPGSVGGSSREEVIRIHRGAYPAIDGELPRVLIVAAHPDDELIAAGLAYLHGACAGGIVDVCTITDGQGGFKYANFAEAWTGIELTREDVGRRELPVIRKEEQTRGLSILGVRKLIRLGQKDHRYSRDRMEVLARDAGVWDLAFVRTRIQKLLEQERYGFVIVLCPTPSTHGHHQAVSLLTVEAAAALPTEERPVLLCCEVETADSGRVGLPPAVLEDALLARLEPDVEPLTIDRTRGFGHRQRLNLKVVASVAVAQHLSQGTMLGYIGRGDLEEYWVMAASPLDARERAEAFFRSLEEQPKFPARSYDQGAGTNAAR